MYDGQPPFTTNPILLKNLLAQVEQGALQLPDFQRGWVWDDDRIKGLIASISKGFPIGALMTLAANGNVTFTARPIEGAEETATGKTPAEYVLDGQQRLTSLYQALLHPGPVATQTVHGRPIKRRYYIDVRAALGPDTEREEAIISVPEDGLLRGAFGREILLDVSTPEREREQHMVPTERLCDEGMWIIEYIQHWEGRDDHPDGSAAGLVMRFKTEIMSQFAQYQLPVIGLAAGTPPGAVCTGIVKLRRIYSFCGRNLPAPKREINDLEVAEQSLNRVKQLNLTIPRHPLPLCRSARKPSGPWQTSARSLKCHLALSRNRPDYGQGQRSGGCVNASGHSGADRLQVATMLPGCQWGIGKEGN